jgi:acyl carrier protein
MGDDTFNRIRSIIAADLEIAASTVMLPTSFIDDLHADSLDMIELIMAFDDAFDVMIPDIAVETIVAVQDAVDYIKQQRHPNAQTCAWPPSANSSAPVGVGALDRWKAR